MNKSTNIVDLRNLSKFKPIYVCIVACVIGNYIILCNSVGCQSR